MMEIRVNNNNNNNNNESDRCRYHPMIVSQERKMSLKGTNKLRPRRDFRFQVIQVHQGPKWFVWPSSSKPSSANSSRRGSKNMVTTTESLPTTSITNDNNNNNNNNSGKLGASPLTTTSTNSIVPTDQSDSPAPRKISAGLKQFATKINTKRRGPNENAVLPNNLIEGAMTAVTSTTATFPHCPTSEPTMRRMSMKQHKAKTEPLTGTVSSSSTFKIISISKKWNDAASEEDEDTRELDLSLASLVDSIPVTVLPTVIISTPTI